MGIGINRAYLAIFSAISGVVVSKVGICEKVLKRYASPIKKTNINYVEEKNKKKKNNLSKHTF